ncbi:glucose dehydrogenase [FAD, quinone]-like [Melitaea cinxia]|uniref:glucose dehydrogenase [FAD, quinone]-like n=1 Tax=Melitaea cinxia TaxID=113334 RepID=UPI001E270B30|nr:glucose dehydrogenase [FAD, quinone]-like [Melitaea cinxia]
MFWQPVNLTAECPANSPLTACSSFGFIYLNLLVQLFGDSLDNKIQRRYPSIELEHDNQVYDFIVVGAGSAGCVVANRLSENPNWKVLLLEAGPEQPDVSVVPGLSTVLASSNIAWSYTAEPNGKSCLAYPEGRCFIGSGKTMGGSSSINSMVYIRGNKVDYDGWAALGNKGWSYNDVLPFFKKSENNKNIEELDKRYHGVSGEQYVSRFTYIDKPSIMMTKAFMERGLPLTDHNGPQQVGVSQTQVTAYSGKRDSTNTAFIQPIRYRRENLIVKVNAEAVKILIDENKRAYGIIYLSNGQKFTAFSKKEVIVSAGSLHSPKLLMLSGIGPNDHLEQLGIPVVQDLAVGENLHDHVSFSGVAVALSNETATTVSQIEILKAIQEYAGMEVNHGPLSGHGSSSTNAFFKSDPNLIAPDVQCHCRDIHDWKEYFNDPLTAGSLQIFPKSFYNAVTPRIGNIAPKSRGVLLLNASNPYGPPLIYPNYFGDESDLIPIVKGMRFLLSLENTEVFRSTGSYFVRDPMPACKDYVWGSDDYHICLAKSYTSTTFHYVGTCKMGPKWDKKAVVDNELRVYGVSGLRVIDASIMPVIVRGNTNAPSIMIGERGVDFVIKYWQQYTRH